MRIFLIGALGMAACWSSSSSKPAAPAKHDITVTEAETVVGSSKKPDPELAREQAIEQARAAGILADSSQSTGPGATAPPPRTGSLDQESIRREIRAHIKQLQYCYERRLLEDPSLAGTSTVSFLVGPDGKVISATGSGFDAKVDACVANVIKDIDFPAPTPAGGSVQVNYPFVFRMGP